MANSSRTAVTATASTTDTGDATIALARLISLALALLSLVWAAMGRPFWADGVDVPAALAWVAALTFPLVLAIGSAALWLRGRRRSRTLWLGWRILLLLSQTGWAAFCAGAGFSLSDIEIGEPVGWGLAVLTFAIALGLLVLAWWIEDRLATRSGKSGQSLSRQ